MKPSKPYRQVEVDMKLQRPSEEVRHIFGFPEITKQPPADVPLKVRQTSGNPEVTEQPTKKVVAVDVELRRYNVEPFGSLVVECGDIVTIEADAVIIPMTPNLVPYRGLSLEVFDRGGKELVKSTFDKAKEDFKEATKKGGLQTGLQAGDTIVVEGRGVAAANIIFLIMPWFWQGSPMDAGKRLRYCIRRGFAVASHAGFSSIALPNLGAGIFGYEPRDSSLTMLEEAMEALLQIEAQVPNYSLKTITFRDLRKETAHELNDALTSVAHRWLPEHRLTTAPQYWGHKTRRLLVMPDASPFFWRRERVKFKKFHGVKRKARRNYVSNIKPLLWRAHKVHQPPPLLVHENTGEVASIERQLRARPFYFRGVTHWLFPSRKSGFHQLRKSAGGHWIAYMQNIGPRQDVRPRL